MSILVFDSGVGGFSVCQAISDKLPLQTIHYCMDNQRLPYGEQLAQTIIERVNQIANQLVTSLKPRLMIIACNTASTIVLPSLRAQLNIPVVGVVPAIKPAAQRSSKKHIALLATPATVTRQYTEQLINEFADDCQVDLIGSTELVEQAEKLIRGMAVDQKTIAQALQPITQQQSMPDQLVLGCTHFPLLKNTLRHMLPGTIQLLDSGNAIASRVEYLLQQNPVFYESEQQQRNPGSFFYTGSSASIAGLENYLWKNHYQQMRQLSI